MNALEKTRQELDATKARLSSTQQSLAEKEAHLANLRIERRKQLEEILEMKWVPNFSFLISIYEWGRKKMKRKSLKKGLFS